MSLHKYEHLWDHHHHQGGRHIHHFQKFPRAPLPAFFVWEEYLTEELPS